MKTDLYLNLCIEQANLSPLHYRHGCVVVKGGKVIGQGFNDYRPGYDGGCVLKTGVLPKAALPFDGHVAARSKPDKSKSPGHPDPPTPNLHSKSKFKAVEALSGHCGGGHHANARLSMHSEMMAINSALTSSSTLAACTVSHVKPCFKLPGDTKRKRELRSRTLAAYVRAVSLDAATGAKAQQQVQRAGKAEGGHHHPRAHHYRQEEEKGNLYQYKNKHDRSKSSKKPSPRSAQPVVGSTNSDTRDADDDDDNVGLKKGDAPPEPNGNTGEFGQRKARSNHLLLPKGHSGSSAPGVKDRMKHPKLVGADVYVVRLSRETPGTNPARKRLEKRPEEKESAGDDDIDTCSVSSGLSGSMGSLHDELKCKGKDSEPPIIDTETSQEGHLLGESRPCYRCVSYMHSVGIKRVFWTTSEGRWEGAKVRDLVDQLEGTMASSSDSSLGLPIPDVFVTKHEVLLLRRLMTTGERRD